MNWLAIRRSQSSSLRNKAGAISRIPHRPPHPSQLIPQLISPPEVLSRTRRLPLLHQLQSPLVALGTILRLGKGAETNELQHLGDRVRSQSLWNLTPVRFPHQLKNLSERPRRIKSSARASRNA